MDNCIVVFDFGTSSGRCLIIAPDGSVLAQANIRWDFAKARIDGMLHAPFDPDRAWQKIANCCRKALSSTNISPGQIAAVITASQRHGSVLLSGEGQALLGLLNADETTTKRWLTTAAEHGDEIFRLTGRWPQPIFLPAHLAWLRESRPGIHAGICRILGIQDWLNFRLCGVQHSEPSIATDLLLFNIHTDRWSDDLIELFDLDPSWLPPILEAGMQVGTVSAQAAEETGLVFGTPVLNGGADSQMAILGMGGTKAGDAAVVFGSTIPVMMLLDRPQLHPEGITWTNRHIFNRQWAMESNAGDGGFALSRFRDEFLASLFDCFGSHEARVPPRLSELDRCINALTTEERSPLASIGPIIFNGKCWPVIDGVICGFNLLGTSGISIMHIYRALVHNIAYSIRANIEQLAGAIGNEIELVRIGGPALQSSPWPQLLADALARTIWIPTEKEITSIGAAVLATTRTGIHVARNAAVKKMVRMVKVEPDDRRSNWHNLQYERWKSIYQDSLGKDTAAVPKALGDPWLSASTSFGEMSG